jgi:WD40 repeat protein
MAEKLINAQVQQREISFKPGGPPAELIVTVINYSDRFASFQLELIAAGISAEEKASWYSLSPEVSTKKPPGAATEFRIAIADTPTPGFIGMMNLTVRVFSLELEGEDRQIIRLIVEQGNSSIPLVLQLPVSQFQGLPQSQLEIPVRVTNPTQLSVNAVVRCFGLDSTWLADGMERRLQIAPGKQAQTSFSCQLSPTTETLSQVYGFKVEASHAKGSPAFAEGSIEVLPAGYVEFKCDPKRRQIPAQRAWLPSWRSQPVTYEVEFENASNLQQEVSIQMVGDVQPNCTLELFPEQETLAPGEIKPLELRATKRRHWFGWVEKLILQVGAVVSDNRVDIRNDIQVLELHVMPIIPRWLQGSGLFFLLLLIIWAFTLEPQGHKSAVNVVQLSGLADWVVSGSNDQTIRTWKLEEKHLHAEGEFAKFDKAVRTIRYRPRDNNEIAVGLENGEIQLWDLLSSKGNRNQPRQAIATFSYQKADRVLALEFSADSRYLFSGHGSGVVFQWDTDPQILQQSQGTSDTFQSRDIINRPKNRFNAGFAVYALELVGSDRQTLAIAGQYNNLVLWNLADNSRQDLPYPIPGSQEDYIFSIDTAASKPNLLATADQQGYITLWDLNLCIASPENCQPIDRWSNGHQEKPVQSVALTADGCHLVSGGADGRIMLWPLTQAGRRAKPEGYPVKQAKNKAKNKEIINSVDVKQVGDYMLIISGSSDRRVRFQRLKRKTIDQKVAPGCGS